MAPHKSGALDLTPTPHPQPCYYSHVNSATSTINAVSVLCPDLKRLQIISSYSLSNCNLTTFSTTLSQKIEDRTKTCAMNRSGKQASNSAEYTDLCLPNTLALPPTLSSHRCCPRQALFCLCSGYIISSLK